MRYAKLIVALLSPVLLAAVPISDALASKTAKPYTLKLNAPKIIKAGKKGKIKIEITPAAGWKLNKDYYNSVQVKGSAGVTITKALQKTKDAKSFSPKKAVFEVQFEFKKSGPAELTAGLKFAVCTASSCVPKKEKLTWKLMVK